jgi:hypothetical protein
MMISHPSSSTTEHDTSNTLKPAQSPPRFGRLGPLFFSFSAAIDPPLDALHHATTQLLDRMQPTHPRSCAPSPYTASIMSPRSAIKASHRPTLSSSPHHFPTTPLIHAGTPQHLPGRCSTEENTALPWSPSGGEQGCISSNTLRPSFSSPLRSLAFPASNTPFSSDQNHLQ